MQGSSSSGTYNFWSMRHSYPTAEISSVFNKCTGDILIPDALTPPTPHSFRKLLRASPQTDPTRSGNKAPEEPGP